MAAIKPQRPDCEPAKWQEWVTANALGSVAGGIVGRRLYPDADGGDVEDKRLFIEECAALVRFYDGAISIDAEQVWTWAQAEVSRSLDEDPRLMELIQKRAKALRPLFGFA